MIDIFIELATTEIGGLCLQSKWSKCGVNKFITQGYFLFIQQVHSQSELNDIMT